MQCAVITPVGPGHEALAAECGASVLAAATSPGRFSAVEHLVVDDTVAALGRSAARNRAVRQAVARGFDWLFFLDADDLMAPGAFTAVSSHLDHLDAVWGSIVEHDADRGVGVLRLPQVMTIDRLTELLLFDPYISLQMGHFVRTAVAAAHPFDEALDAGEDFDYYLRVWRAARCRKIDAVFFVNRQGMHSTGRRSADGAQWRREVAVRIDRCRRRDRIPIEDAIRLVTGKRREFDLMLNRPGRTVSVSPTAVDKALPMRIETGFDAIDPPRHLLVTGFSRSGTTLLYNMLRCSVDGLGFLDREMAASQMIGHTSGSWATKRPLDVLAIEDILLANRFCKAIVVIVTVRDIRDLITSRHRDVPGHYFMGHNHQYFIPGDGGRPTYTNPGVVETYDAIRRLLATWPPETIQLVRYEELVGDTDRVQQTIGDRLRLRYNGSFRDFHKQDVPQALQGPMNGVRPVERSRTRRWRQPEHHWRIFREFSRCPQLFDILEALGYEKNRDWFAEIEASPDAHRRILGPGRT